MAQADALVDGSHFITPDNVKNVAKNVLRHRITPSYEAEANGISSDEIVEKLLSGVKVP